MGRKKKRQTKEHNSSLDSTELHASLPTSAAFERTLIRNYKLTTRKNMRVDPTHAVETKKSRLKVNSDADVQSPPLTANSIESEVEPDISTNKNVIEHSVRIEYVERNLERIETKLDSCLSSSTFWAVSGIVVTVVLAFFGYLVYQVDSLRDRSSTRERVELAPPAQVDGSVESAEKTSSQGSSGIADTPEMLDVTD